MRIGGVAAAALAAEFGTPTRVVDEEDFRTHASDGPPFQGAKYTVALADRHAPAATAAVTVVGRHCEDEIARDVDLPADIHPGELLAVAGTGAYHYSMGSCGNLVGRPPLIAVAGGRSDELVRRETVADLLARDCG